MPASCALNFDHVGIVQRARLGAVLTNLAEARWSEVENALLIACGFNFDAHAAKYRCHARPGPMLATCSISEDRMHPITIYVAGLR
jgi:hypothetical protein